MQLIRDYDFIGGERREGERERYQTDGDDDEAGSAAVAYSKDQFLKKSRLSVLIDVNSIGT